MVATNYSGTDRNAMVWYWPARCPVDLLDGAAETALLHLLVVGVEVERLQHTGAGPGKLPVQLSNCGRHSAVLAAVQPTESREIQRSISGSSAGRVAADIAQY